MKTIKSAVNILSGITSAFSGAKTVRDPRFGEMFLGPEYDRYAELRDYQQVLNALLLDVESLSIAKDQALSRIAEIQKTYATVEHGHLMALREALEAPRDTAQCGSVNLTAASKVVAALARLRERLSPLDFGVSSLAYAVPKPPHPNAVPAVVGQRLGSGACWRGE